MMTRLVPKTRWQAFVVHLTLSALIAATLVAIILFLWYPAPYFQTMGGRGAGHR